MYSSSCTGHYCQVMPMCVPKNRENAPAQILTQLRQRGFAPYLLLMY